jgi:tripartite-type tricarboxylate transporter receptor subunit TctC
MLTPPLSHAQSATRMVVAFAPGGIADTVARLVAQRLGSQGGRTVIVENRGGAGGNIAAAALMTAPPGTSSLLVHTAAFAINASMSATPGYDPRAYVPVSLIATTPEVIAAHPDHKAPNLAAFIARNKGRRISFSTAGVGSSSHLAGEYLLRHLGGLDAVHVPFQGGAPAVLAAVGGQVDLVVTSLPPAVQHLRSGKLAGIALAAARRSTVLPDIPTAEEGGHKLEAFSWVGVLAPPGTPTEAARALNAEIGALLRAPEMKERLEGMIFDPVIASAEEFGAFIRAEVDKWAQMVKATGAAQKS